MMFDEYTVNKILAGEKTVTRRLRKPLGKRPAIPGAIHKLKIRRDKKVYGKILINYCIKMTLNASMTNEEARKEGFDTAEEYISYFKKVNKIDDDTDLNGLPIWYIKFIFLDYGD